MSTAALRAAEASAALAFPGFLSGWTSLLRARWAFLMSSGVGWVVKVLFWRWGGKRRG
jgi:hypothetical protein